LKNKRGEKGREGKWGGEGGGKAKRGKSKLLKTIKKKKEHKKTHNKKKKTQKAKKERNEKKQQKKGRSVIRCWKTARGCRIGLRALKRLNKKGNHGGKRSPPKRGQNKSGQGEGKKTWRSIGGKNGWMPRGDLEGNVCSSERRDIKEGEGRGGKTEKGGEQGKISDAG